MQLTLVAAIGGTIFGTLLAMARLSSFKPLALAAAGYVNLMRSLPLLLVIFWFYFLVPVLVQIADGLRSGRRRSAPNAPPTSPSSCSRRRISARSCAPASRAFAAARSAPAYALGLNYWQAMRRIVLPQAFRNMLPVLLTQTIILFQDVSLVSLLNVTDFVGAAVKIAQRDSRVVEMYLFVAVVYFVLCFALSVVVKRLQQRIAIVR